MIFQEEGPDDFVIRLSRDEVLLLNNALNEVCNAIEVWEFSTRLGSKREEALEMLNEIGRALA
ncbi:MAG: hypothetical protein HKL80_03255 [Acidimicrobiales bacterium]|nr:hypothetical protein [Acidimicrobiales bacterium]